MDNYNTPSPSPIPGGKKPNILLIVVIVTVALLIGSIIYGVFKINSLNTQVQQATADNEQLQLTNEQLMLSNEFDAINSEFSQYENQIMKIDNDSVLAKYQAAKTRIESLMAELDQARREGNKSKAQIAQLQNKIRDLQGEIDTLKALLRHYIAQIDSLGRENEGLRAENTEIKVQNQELSTRVENTTRRAEELSERMTLAEKLNVTGVSLTALKKNGKNEKNVTKAQQLMVSFTIPQNNSTPVGNKTIYLRIISPEGQLLGGAGSFSFEGGSVGYTARKVIEYAGQEISGIRIYWDVNATLNPGTYTVELFCDNYRLTRTSVTLNK